MIRSNDCPRWVVVGACLALWLAAGCGAPEGPVLVRSFPMDDAEEIQDIGEHVNIDTDWSVDGGGSLHIFTEDKMLVNLHEFAPGKIKGDSLTLSAELRTEVLTGNIFFDLWIFTADGAPRWTRRLCGDIGRSTNWQKVEVGLPLLPGEVPQKMRIAVFLDGKGHLWIDNLQLFSSRKSDATGQE